MSVMEDTKKNALMNCSSLDELLNVEFGEVGTKSREEFDKETEAFCLAQTLREERLRAGLTQEQLAEKLEVSRQAVSKWERDISCPDISSIPKLAEILNIDVKELISGKTENK